MIEDAPILIAIGLAAGLFGGLLGIGGSVITLPAMALTLGRRDPVEYQHAYQAAAMIVAIFVTAPATVWHNKQRMVMRRVVACMIPGALAGIFAGVFVSNLGAFSGEGALYLRRILGVFLLYVLGYNVYRLIRQNRLPDPTDDDLSNLARLRSAAAVGVPMGFLGGLLGIGGGSLCVPLQQIFLRMPLRYAIANSAATLLAVELFGAVYKAATLPPGIDKGYIYVLQIAVTLIPTCFIGSYLGSKLTYSLPRNIVRVVFCLLMFYASGKLLVAAPQPPADLANAPTSAAPSRTSITARYFLTCPGLRRSSQPR